MFSFISKLFNQTPKQLRWYSKPREDFRASPSNVVWANQRLNLDPRGQTLQAYLADGLMESAFFPGDRLTTEQAAMEYARQEGYKDCLRRLQQAAVPLPTIEDAIPADYDQNPPEDQETAET